jgi:hypothetical protein
MARVRPSLRSWCAMIAAYSPDAPGVPIYSIATTYNRGRQRARTHYARIARKARRRRVPLPDLSQRLRAVHPAAPRARARGAGRPRAAATRSSVRAGDSPDGEPGEQPHLGRVAPAKARLTYGIIGYRSAVAP